jgi:hypothetical protein
VEVEVRRDAIDGCGNGVRLEAEADSSFGSLVAMETQQGLSEGTALRLSLCDRLDPRHIDMRVHRTAA